MNKKQTDITNALTIDVEDYFHVHALSSAIKSCDWDSFECFVEESTMRLLSILEEYGTRATFFVLGWVAERYPFIVTEVIRKGHEVASHGYQHTLMNKQSKEEFRSEVRRSKMLLEELTGEKIIGFRAPCFSVRPSTLWALGILRKEGFLYDSSIFPIKHDYYGFPDAPRFPFLFKQPRKGPLVEQMIKPIYISLDGNFSSSCSYDSSNRIGNSLQELRSFLKDGSLIEWPLSTIRLFGRNIPCAGGGYFRLFPYYFTRKFIRSLNMAGEPVMFYIHPWEFCSHLPRVANITPMQQFRTYFNLDKTENRFRRLLQDFHFSPIRDILNLSGFRESASALSDNGPKKVGKS
jgi:polysaccharide deacetylase family protein (PEP-CTERM system associated)